MPGIDLEICVIPRMFRHKTKINALGSFGNLKRPTISNDPSSKEGFDNFEYLI